MGQWLAKGKSLVTYPNVVASWQDSGQSVVLWEDDMFQIDNQMYTKEQGLLKLNVNNDMLNKLLATGEMSTVSKFEKTSSPISVEKQKFYVGKNLVLGYKRADDNQTRWRPFLVWNFVAAFFHLLNAVSTFAADPVQVTNMYPMYQGFTGWKPKDMFCKASNFTCPKAGEEIKCMSVLGYERGRVDDDMIMAIQPSLTKSRYSVSLFWLIFSFHFLSFLFQFFAGACFKPVYAKHVINNGVNSLRFLEYSISASLMLLCIALIGSLQDVYAHVGIGVLTAGTMLFGLIAEILFSDEFLPEEMLKNEPQATAVASQNLQLFRRARFNNELGDLVKQNYNGDVAVSLYNAKYHPKDDCDGVHIKLRQLGWVAHFAGWITMIGAYGGIVLNHYFWSVVQAEDEYEDFEGPPAWITGLIFAIMSLYMIFGFAQLFQFCAKDPWFQSFKGRKQKQELKPCCLCVHQNYSGDGKEIKCRICCRCCEVTERCKGCTLFSLNEGVELFYVLNSLVTKSILGWVIISQLLALNFEVTETVDCE